MGEGGKGHRKKKSGRKAEKRKAAEQKKKGVSDEQVRCPTSLMSASALANRLTRAEQQQLMHSS